MWTLFEPFGTVFLFIWCRNAVPTPLFGTTPKYETIALYISNLENDLVCLYRNMKPIAHVLLHRYAQFSADVRMQTL